VAVPKVVLGLMKFVMTVPPTAEQCRSLSWERAAADTAIGFPLAETNAKNNTAKDKTSPAGPIFRTVMNNLPFFSIGRCLSGPSGSHASLTLL
jgi:hypothetical protein